MTTTRYPMTASIIAVLAFWFVLVAVLASLVLPTQYCDAWQPRQSMMMQLLPLNR